MNYRSYFERMKGVKLPADWDVHHIDFNRENNDIENLYAMPRVMHRFIHKHWGLCDRQELNLELKNWITELNCIYVDGRRINNPNRLPNDRKTGFIDVA